MKVNHDFFMYRSGVYQCTKLTSSHRTSFHSVRLVGWGEERQWGGNVKYWVSVYVVYYTVAGFASNHRPYGWVIG